MQSFRYRLTYCIKQKNFCILTLYIFCIISYYISKYCFQYFVVYNSCKRFLRAMTTCMILQLTWIAIHSSIDLVIKTFGLQISCQTPNYQILLIYDIYNLNISRFQPLDMLVLIAGIGGFAEPVVSWRYLQFWKRTCITDK